MWMKNKYFWVESTRIRKNQKKGKNTREEIIKIMKMKRAPTVSISNLRTVSMVCVFGVLFFSDSEHFDTDRSAPVVN